MCLDDEDGGSDEVSPSGVVHLDPQVRDVASKRYQALSRGKHLCLELGGKLTVNLRLYYST